MGAAVNAELKEFMDRAREAEAWAGIVPDPELRAQWIEIAAGYRTMARERLGILLNPAASMVPGGVPDSRAGPRQGNRQ
jgi:hypothetical protein